MTSQAKIAVIYYSTYGHITKLTEEVVAGAKSTGAHVDLYQIPETLSAEILGKQHAIPRPDVPVIGPHDLVKYDGFIFGFPTRYGRAPAQVSAFFDSTGTEWATGALVGKFAAIYTSAASQHGGLETTALTTYPFFVHHGMNVIASGFASSELTKLDEIIGGSAYGAGTVAGGDGSRQPTAADLAVAKAQGVHVAKTINTFVAGKAALAAGAGQTFAAEAVPTAVPAAISATQPASEQSKPYQVDEPGAAAPANVTTTSAVPAAVPQEKPAAAPTTNGASAAPKKKSSIFARCCGSEKDYK